MALTIAEWDSSNNRFKRSTIAAVPDMRAGQNSIGSGVSSVAVSFSSTIANTNYAVTCTLLNTTDTNPQFQPITVTAFSTSGFTAKWNVPTDSANYVLHWNAIANT